MQSQRLRAKQSGIIKELFLLGLKGRWKGAERSCFLNMSKMSESTITLQDTHSLKLPMYTLV